MEIQPAHAPQVKQRRKIELAEDRRQHHSRQHRLRQIFQKPGQIEQAARERDESEDQGGRRAGAWWVSNREKIDAQRATQGAALQA